MSPHYVQLMHGILFQISLKLNTSKLLECRSSLMKEAQTHVLKAAPVWASKMIVLTEGLPLENSITANEEVMKELVVKIFNSKGNSIIKRYYSTYLARGGKKASQSSSRELRKQEGLGKRVIKKEIISNKQSNTLTQENTDTNCIPNGP